MTSGKHPSPFSKVGIYYQAALIGCNNGYCQEACSRCTIPFLQDATLGQHEHTAWKIDLAITFFEVFSRTQVNIWIASVTSIKPTQSIYQPLSFFLRLGQHLLNPFFKAPEQPKRHIFSESSELFNFQPPPLFEWVHTYKSTA